MILVLMGICGSGKTTIGKCLAENLGWQFADADDFHTQANINKMATGQPLNDQDRLPWLMGMHRYIAGLDVAQQSGVVTCSALKASYRQLLITGDSALLANPATNPTPGSAPDPTPNSDPAPNSGGQACDPSPGNIADPSFGSVTNWSDPDPHPAIGDSASKPPVAKAMEFIRPLAKSDMKEKLLLNLMCDEISVEGIAWEKETENPANVLPFDLVPSEDIPSLVDVPSCERITSEEIASVDDVGILDGIPDDSEDAKFSADIRNPDKISSGNKFPSHDHILAASSPAEISIPISDLNQGLCYRDNAKSDPKCTLTPEATRDGSAPLEFSLEVPPGGENKLGDVLFVYLKGSSALIGERMNSRKGHFMPLSLLQSQIDTLEEPSTNENSLTIDVSQSVDEIVGQVVTYIQSSRKLWVRS